MQHKLLYLKNNKTSQEKHNNAILVSFPYAYYKYISLYFKIKGICLPYLLDKYTYISRKQKKKFKVYY